MPVESEFLKAWSPCKPEINTQHAMKLQRLGFKLFVDDPATVALEDFVPIFHSWIQKQIIEEHLLVDVHNYGHVHQGPGILLVAHQGNFSMDLGGNRLGLLYNRKRDIDGTSAQRFKTILKTTLQACTLLEGAPELGGKLRFKTDEVLIVANDRLHTPNESGTFDAFQPLLSELFADLFGEGTFTTDWREDKRERFTVTVSTNQSLAVAQLLERLS